MGRGDDDWRLVIFAHHYVILCLLPTCLSILSSRLLPVTFAPEEADEEEVVSGTTFRLLFIAPVLYIFKDRSRAFCLFPRTFEKKKKADTGSDLKPIALIDRLVRPGGGAAAVIWMDPVKAMRWPDPPVPR